MNGARIGRGCLVAAGTLVPEGMLVEDGTLVMGVPAWPRRPVTDAEADAALTNAHTYVASRPAR